MAHAVRVMIIDGSAYMRFAISRHLQTETGIVVAGSARDGADALQKIPSLRPDVLVLEAEVVSNGSVSVLQRIMAQYALPMIVLDSSQPDSDGAAMAQSLAETVQVCETASPVAPIYAASLDTVIAKIKLAADGESGEKRISH